MIETTTLFVRAVRIVGVIGVAVMVTDAASAAAQTPELGSAESFAVLGETSVSNTGASAITGDVGVSPGSTISGFPPGTVAAGGSLHEGDAVAAQAHVDAEVAYQEIVGRTCPPANALVGDLGGRSLASGVYCFSGAAQLTGTLTLTGAGPWIFQLADTLTTAAGASVVVAGSTQICDGSSVFWQVGGTSATLGAGTTFVGNLLARTDVSLSAAATVDGRVLALDGSATTNANTIEACSGGRLFPAHVPVKLTGGGQINVPQPNSTDPSEIGTGRGNYGFNAHPPLVPGGAATGHLNYLNHTTGLHGQGTVTDVDVLSVHPDGAPRMARFSGTCDGVPGCTFSVTVEDNGEPATSDRFGITIVSPSLNEERALRIVRNGNIQVHESLATTVNAASFDLGQVMKLKASLTPTEKPVLVDAYLVLRLPDGQMLSWTGHGFAPGIVPIIRNFVPGRYSGQVLELTIPPGAPKGTYAWLSALAAAGTLNLLTPITETPFSIK